MAPRSLALALALLGLSSASADLIHMDVNLKKVEKPALSLSRLANQLEGVESLAVTTSSEVDDADFVDVDLDDYHDVQIFTTILMGSDLQPFDMIFDTGSNWLWVQSDDCGNCPNQPRFYEAQSSTYKSLNKTKALQYGTGRVEGIISEDQVCLVEGRCASDFKFLFVREQQDLYNLAASGLVGLSPSHFQNQADLFIEKMKASGVIDEMVFSMSIGHGDIQSKITFGGYDIDSYAKDSSKVNWHSIRSGSRHWELGLEGFGFKFEEATYGFSYGSRSKPIIVDSGTSFLLMPKGELLAFLKFIQRKVGIDFKLDVIPMGECTVEQYEQFPDLVMVIDGMQYTVPRESYLGIEMGFQCYMKIMTHDLIPFWILGLNFFENYYTIFDQEQLKVGFAPSIHSKIKEESLLANMIYLDDNFEDIVDNNVKEEQRMRLFMQRTVFGFVCAIGIITTIVYLRQKQQSKRRRQGQYVQFQGEEAAQAPNLMI